MKNLKETGLWKFFKFSIVSWSGALIKIGLFALFNEVLKWDYWLSYLISLLISLVYGYILNKKVTFKYHGEYGKTTLLMGIFYLIFIPGSTLLTDLLCKYWNEYLVLIIIMVLNFYLEYVYDKYIVFPKKKEKIGTN